MQEFRSSLSLRKQSGASVQIPHWRRVTTQNWVVLLIGSSKFSTNQKQYLEQGSDKPGKTADITRQHHWFSHEMTCEKRKQKFHTDDASKPGSE